MATLDDIPTLPPTNGSLAGSDLIAVIDSQDRRSPKRTTLDLLAQLLGFAVAGGDLSVPGALIDELVVANSIAFPHYTVSGLPSAATTPYARAFVTDCDDGLSSATIGTSGFAGGGANVVPVYSNGTVWVIG